MGYKIRKAVGLAAMALGLSLVFSAGWLTMWNMSESDEAGEYVHEISAQLEEKIRESPMQAYLSNPQFIPDYKLYPDMDMPVQELDGRLYAGEIAFPTLDLKFAVQSGWSMANLAKSPCVYSGTAYDDNAFVICAHNYTTHFWPIRNLNPGDLITFTDCDGNVFEYEVAGSEQIDPRPVSRVTESEHDLVLFTCAFGGTKRITVFCDEI